MKNSHNRVVIIKTILNILRLQTVVPESTWINKIYILTKENHHAINLIESLKFSTLERFQEQSTISSYVCPRKEYGQIGSLSLLE